MLRRGRARRGPGAGGWRARVRTGDRWRAIDGHAARRARARAVPSGAAGAGPARRPRAAPPARRPGRGHAGSAVAGAVRGRRRESGARRVSTPARGRGDRRVARAVRAAAADGARAAAIPAAQRIQVREGAKARGGVVRGGARMDGRWLLPPGRARRRHRAGAARARALHGRRRGGGGTLRDAGQRGVRRTARCRPGETGGAAMSDAVFDTPLTGTSLVEASAGTGKTFALAGLYVRAVIEGGLRPQQILAVTFTEAATQELRARVHLRLQQAQAMAAVWSPGDPPEREGDDGETGLLRRMLHAAVAAGESPLALRLRLARAARDLEQAQIATIHGFCRRLLAEHALEAGLVPDDARVETSQARAHRELAVALWREHAGDPAGAAFLRRRFGGIDGLCEALGDLLSHEPLLPDAQALEDAPTLDAAWTAARTAFARHGAEAREALERALGERVISSAQDKMPDIEVLWAWFDAQDDRVPPAWPKGLERIGTAWLRTICLKGREDRCPCSPLFDAVDALLAAEEADMLRRLHAFRRAALRRNAERKAALQVRDFDDLIGQVHAAVRDDAHRGALARAVRGRYRLALIDEFQDTDGRQWDIFRSLFVEGADGCGLVLVGDPKQAIYRFRGGDVQTYVAARGSVEHDGIRLERNFRSRPCVLDVTNRLFQGLPPGALGSGIGFEPVAPGGRARDD